MFSIKKCLLYATLVFNAGLCSAQFTVTGQLIQRGEYRNGYGKLIEKGADPAIFISQRFRLQAGHTMHRLKLYGSVQDIRTWGSTPQIKVTDPHLSLHEAWAEIYLDTSWSVKLGRQELVYDNARFLGNLDWALQARAHDLVLVKYEKKNSKFHIGAAYNQENETLSGNVFMLQNQYKTAQMLHYNFKGNGIDFAFLFWNNGKQFVLKDSLGKVTCKSLRYTQTIGIPTIFYELKPFTLGGFYYHQLGQDINDRNVNAFDASLYFSGLFNVNDRNTFKATVGAEVISGTNSNAAGNNNFSFSPFYGTNHAHNGYMDLFYVNGRHENSTGLNDLFWRFKYAHKSDYFVSLEAHSFSTYANYYYKGVKLDKSLGTEIDVTGGFVFSDKISVQAGYSHLFHTSSLANLQGVAGPQTMQNWMYLMLIVRTDSGKKFTGIQP